MKKYSQCLMCSYVLGRSCKYTKGVIPDEIYNNAVTCKSFKSIADEDLDCDDKCCSEVKRYDALNK